MAGGNYAEDLRYVSRWGHWMRWDGLRWVDDDTLHVFDLARGVCRAASTECGDAKERAAIRIAAAQTVTAIERLARADRRHAARVEQWDSHLWLLKTPAGTIDLRTGEMHEHSRNEYITKITAAGPSGECPQWLRFLERVTAGDRDLQSFLQRMIGYSLTGCTHEHALFFLYEQVPMEKVSFCPQCLGCWQNMQRLLQHHPLQQAQTNNTPQT